MEYLKYAVVLVAVGLGSAYLTGCAIRGSIDKSVVCGLHKGPRPFTERNVTVEGVRLHVHDAGTGDPPVVLVHGFGGTTYSWRHLLAPLAARHRVLAFDLPGHGYSEKPRHFDYGAVHLGEMLVTLLKQERIEHAVVIGNSYGGAVSVAAALRAQEQDGPDQTLISKMVLIDAAGYAQKTPWHVKMLRLPILNRLVGALVPPPIMIRIAVSGMYGSRGKPEKDQLREYANALACSGTRRAFRAYAKQMIPDDIEQFTARYPEIQIPTLVITGNRDRVVPPAVAERFDHDLPHSKLVVIDGAGHIPQEEIPAEVLTALSEFLGEDL